MGTKNNPSKFEERMQQIKCGERPDTDFAVVQEAIDCAKAGQQWRKDNYGIWRRK